MKQPAFWNRRGVRSTLLLPLAAMYGWLARRRMVRHDVQHVSAPVICVGNNTVGGTGKTPLVLLCAELLKQAGRTPHVISRGYKGTYEGTLRVDTAQHSAAEVGDEPLLIAHHAPCWVSRSRVDAARAAVDAGSDVVIMDDGMQNPTLHKDLTLMVVDGETGFGNRRLLPAGPCRESLADSLTKADALMVMGEAKHPDVRSVCELTDCVFHVKLEPSSELPKVPLLAFAGIGRPEKFFEMVRNMGGNVSAQQSFADHHAYSPRELEQLTAQADALGAKLITTEKDWQRLDTSIRRQIAYVPVSANMADVDAFETLLLKTAGGGA